MATTARIALLPALDTTVRPPNAVEANKNYYCTTDHTLESGPGGSQKIYDSSVKMTNDSRGVHADTYAYMMHNS